MSATALRTGMTRADADIVAAYRSGLSIREVADVFRVSPTRVAQIVAATNAVQVRCRRMLRSVTAG